jgi:hypothetical protein
LRWMGEEKGITKEEGNKIKRTEQRRGTVQFKKGRTGEEGQYRLRRTKQEKRDSTV